MRAHLLNHQDPSVSLSERMAVDIFIFKTNVRYKKDIKAIVSTLITHPSILKWNIDREDVDKILRVESLSNNAQQIITTIKLAGYCCEELND